MVGEQGGGAGAGRTLADVPIGGRARVKRVCGTGDLCRRMLDMGLVRGAEIQMLRNAPLRDPLEVVVRGTRLAIRRREAAQVEVESA